MDINQKKKSGEYYSKLLQVGGGGDAVAIETCSDIRTIDALPDDLLVVTEEEVTGIASTVHQTENNSAHG